MVTAALCAAAIWTFGQSAVRGQDTKTKQNVEQSDDHQKDSSSERVSGKANQDRDLKVDKTKDKGAVSGLTATGYVRPNAEKRFKRYVNDVVGPFAVARYAATAGLLTWRDSPREWGDKWAGFGRRFANTMGKSAIRNTTIYGLDEALKVDSTFYRSRKRSVGGRLRNSVFSAVTARSKEGKRVIGVPRIVGGFASEVTSSSLWYPERYDYVHGLKGGAISIGIDIGANIFREFVWK